MRDQITTTISKIQDTMKDQFSQLTDRTEAWTSDASEQIASATDKFAADYTRWNDRVLDAIVENTRSVVTTAVKSVDMAAERLPDVDLPFADRLPTPAKAGEQYVTFVERAAEFNRDMNSRVLDMLPTSVAAQKPAPKATAKKATAKKATAKKATAKKASKKRTAAKK